MDSDLAAFGEGLATLNLSETDIAVALLWFTEQRSEATELSAARLAELIHDLALRGQINVYRLAGQLGYHSDVVGGKKKGTFKLKLASRAALTNRYSLFLKRPMPKIENHILEVDDFKGKRPYLEALVVQINGTYQLGFYDGCIVLCRRIIETLLIESFEQNNKAAAIKKNNEYLQLSDIIGIARSGQYIKLARGTPDALEEIKKAGDAGAHSRTYITKQKDVDDLKLTFRRIVSELMHLAKLN